VKAGAGPAPVVLKTANGLAPARTGSVGELRLGNIVARDLKVVVSPTLGELDVIGMNFLSKLQSWRVEGRTLVLVPHRPQPERRSVRPASSGPDELSGGDDRAGGLA
jgi:aspartyl protease family protein